MTAAPPVEVALDRTRACPSIAGEDQARAIAKTEGMQA
jgi:hypothetical protein